MSRRPSNPDRSPVPPASGPGSAAPATNPGDRSHVVRAAVSDVVAVVVFTVLAFLAHGGKSSLPLLAGIYLAGLAVGWLAARAWRSPAAVRPTGISVWIVTVVVGQAIWSIGHDGRIPVVMVLISAVVLAALLLGWRAMVAGIEKQNRTAAH